VRLRVTFSQDGFLRGSEQLFAVSPAFLLGGRDIESRESVSDGQETLIGRKIPFFEAKST
jgi:hypothetical protein